MGDAHSRAGGDLPLAKKRNKKIENHVSYRAPSGWSGLMSSYIVLARKWRPQTFADLVGQQHIAVTLKNAIMQNRVAHAFLFTGSRGVGKTSSARIFAKALNCEHAPCEEPCNACLSCREITEGRSLDVVEIDGASNRGINEIREVLEAVRYAPSRDRYKIYIIDEVHMLTTEAFNALLKTLEEPPAHVVFIFATTDPNKIPVTILSRCQRYDFKRIGNEDLYAHLSSIAQAEHIEFEPSALRLIARTARGGVRDALSAMDQIIAFTPPPITGERAAEILGVATRETLTSMVKAILDRDVARAIACIGRVEHYGQNLSLFANDLLELLRDATIVAAAPQADIPTGLSPAERAEVLTWLETASIDRFQRLFQIWYQTTDTLSKNLSPRLALEMAAIRMCKVETVVPLDNILRKLDAITRALSGHLDIKPDALESVRAYLSRGTESSTNCPPPSDESRHSTTPPASSETTGATNATPQQDDEKKKPADKRRRPDENALEEKTATGNGDDAPWPREKRPALDDATTNNPPPAPPATEELPENWNDAPTVENNRFSSCEWNDASRNIDDDGDESDDAATGIGSIDEKCEKILAVSGDRLKRPRLDSLSQDNADELLYGWRQIVQELAAPLSTIMSKAHVDALTRENVRVSLPRAYEDIITREHIDDVARVVAKLLSPDCRVSVSFDQKDDDSETLAAIQAQRDFEIREQAFDRIRNSPLFKDVCRRFDVKSESVHFTFNQDRTSS